MSEKRNIPDDILSMVEIWLLLRKQAGASQPKETVFRVHPEVFAAITGLFKKPEGGKKWACSDLELFNSCGTTKIISDSTLPILDLRDPLNLLHIREENNNE